LLIAFGDLFDRNRFGSPDFTFQPTGDQQAIVTDVLRGSPAWNAGVRTGHRVSASWIRLAAVLGVGSTAGVRAGQRISIQDLSTGKTIEFTASPLARIYAPDRVIAHVLRILCLIFALVLFWREPGDRAARALAAFLLAYNMQGWGNSGSFLYAHSITQTVTDVASLSMLLTLVLFACWFPNRYPRDLRRTIAWAACVFALTSLIIRLDALRHAFTGVLWLFNGLYLPWTSYVEPAVFGLMTVIALVVDFRTSSQLDRLRLEWLTVGMALQIYAAIISSYSILAPLFNGVAGASTALGNAINDTAQLIGTVCMLYAFLHYRVLDITFAINRATVFAVFSTVVVGLFVVVEYLISKYVEANSHVTGLAITLVAALAVGISLRTIHRYVDRVVDQVVFRQRHRDEEAIRTFGRRARFITDEVTLEERTVHTLDLHARAEGSALYLRGDGREYACAVSSLRIRPDAVDCNDPYVVMMKDSGGTCLLGDPSTAIPGELVLPMLVRGELFGFVACGKRRIRELYAPDELDAMTYMVDRVGIQLDALRTARMQNMLGEIMNLVRAHLLLGGDGSTLIANIAEITGASGAVPPPAPAKPPMYSE
jgi:hypothetical protein